MKSIFFSKKIKKIVAYLTIVCVCIFSIVYVYLKVNEKTNSIKKQQLVDSYFLFKKFYSLNSDIKEIKIKMENFFDPNLNKEIVDSTPVFFKNIDDNKIRNRIELTVCDFEDKKKYFNYYDYFIKEESNGLVLYGKLNENEFLKVKKQFCLEKDLSEEFYNLLYLVTFFLIFNILIYIYLLKIIKEIQIDKKNNGIEFKNLQESTKQIAFVDTLTKAATRIKFNEVLDDLIKTASRFDNQVFGLIFIDIDNFKAINDKYGHNIGDIVLKTIAEIILKNIRPTDFFARWGGEEFIVLYPMSPKKNSIILADRLRKKIEEYSFKEIIENVTCSFGVVEYEKGDTIEIILERADKLLYKAKKNGKNRVEF